MENVIAPLVSAEQHLRHTLTRMIQTARSPADAENIRQLLSARVDINTARRELVKLHPNRLED